MALLKSVFNSLDTHKNSHRCWKAHLVANSLHKDDMDNFLVQLLEFVSFYIFRGKKPSLRAKPITNLKIIEKLLLVLFNRVYQSAVFSSMLVVHSKQVYVQIIDYGPAKSQLLTKFPHISYPKNFPLLIGKFKDRWKECLLPEV